MWVFVVITLSIGTFLQIWLLFHSSQEEHTLIIPGDSVIHFDFLNNMADLQPSISSSTTEAVCILKISSFSSFISLFYE